ncbi:hypothetical protein GX48_02033 [Paracoccidioides brasiliensis]|nr:hypothetical protein GX48_02033 [Paracoccidioides brasiliensis]
MHPSSDQVMTIWVSKLSIRLHVITPFFKQVVNDSTLLLTISLPRKINTAKQPTIFYEPTLSVPMPSKGSTTASPPTPASTPRSSSESSIERLKAILQTAKKPSPTDAKPSPKSKAVTMEARAVSLPATTRRKGDAFL